MMRFRTRQKGFGSADGCAFRNFRLFLKELVRNSAYLMKNLVAMGAINVALRATDGLASVERWSPLPRGGCRRDPAETS